jgi:tetratricopeptide (TPR) repeat protein
MSKAPDQVYEHCSILMQDSKFEEGLKYCTEQMKEYPEDPLLMYLKGAFYQGMKKFDESIKCFDESIKRDADNWPPYTSKAQSLYALGKIDEGIKNLEIAMKKDGSVVRIPIYLALFYVVKKDEDKGKEYLRKAIDIDSNEAFIEYRNLMKSFMSSPDFPAEKMAEIYKGLADFKKTIQKLKKKK